MSKPFKLGLFFKRFGKDAPQCIRRSGVWVGCHFLDDFLGEMIAQNVFGIAGIHVGPARSVLTGFSAEPVTIPFEPGAESEWLLRYGFEPMQVKGLGFDLEF